MTKTKPKKEETPEEQQAREFVEATAQAIITLASGVRKVLDGKLKKEAVVLLVQAACGGSQRISKEMVEKVLTAAGNLDKTFLK